MTDEERFCNKRCRSNPCRHRCEYVSDYLDGLAKGKPQWHKVADGDYPPCKKSNYYSVNVLTDRGEIVYYNYDEECWVAEPASVEIDPPIAWCEIPKYEE